MNGDGKKFFPTTFTLLERRGHEVKNLEFEGELHIWEFCVCDEKTDTSLMSVR